MWMLHVAGYLMEVQGFVVQTLKHGWFSAQPNIVFCCQHRGKQAREQWYVGKEPMKLEISLYTIHRAL